MRLVELPTQEGVLPPRISSMPVGFSCLSLLLSHQITFESIPGVNGWIISSWGSWAQALRNVFSWSGHSPWFKQLAQSVLCWQLRARMCMLWESVSGDLAFKQVESCGKLVDPNVRGPWGIAELARERLLIVATCDKSVTSVSCGLLRLPIL